MFNQLNSLQKHSKQTQTYAIKKNVFNFFKNAVISTNYLFKVWYCLPSSIFLNFIFGNNSQRKTWTILECHRVSTNDKRLPYDNGLINVYSYQKIKSQNKLIGFSLRALKISNVWLDPQPETLDSSRSKKGSFRIIYLHFFSLFYHPWLRI